MKNSLLWKLLGIDVLAIGVVILVVWLAIDYLAADYFMVLMDKYNISPTETHQMFLDAAHRYFLWASLFALGLTGFLSLLLTKRVLSPLSQMTRITGKIAAGDYTERVRVTSKDEVAQVADAFNRMVDNLQRLEQLRRTMIVDVAHELRTPLTNMRGYLEALMDGVAAPSPATFASLHEETLRLVKLVDDLLQLAKADAARTTLQPQPLILSEWITQALEPFRNQFHAKGISVETAYAPGAERVLADRDKINQVIRNLLQNALQYTPSGGFLIIHTEQLSGEVKATFINTSEGIAEKDLPYIFERFYRGEKSRSRAYGGAGIGLAIVRELVEAHGGKVAATVGSGEVAISFTLPTMIPSTTA
jgi:signal transduction histidine kinase